MSAIGYSQGLSYNCPRLIQLGCGQPCIDVKATFPDIRSSTANYTYKRVQPSGCLPYIDPSTPGPSANLTIDDRYSTVITMPFNFKFFNDTYNQLVASTNGYVSFDVSLATTFSHWQNRGILPNTQYDPALIMGPYHDLYPQPPASSTSPTQQVKYEVIGSAPNRKWILSFYKLPLFDCEDLIENTHQIVLHETTGIVEVYIKDMQICNTWPTTNPGRSMLGMQNMARNKAVMVTGRTMNDAPWGSIGMDEFWRFIPSEGNILYSKVELLDAAGGVVAVGDTTRIDQNTFSTTFTNICPPENATTTYFVKTTYRDPNNPGSFFYSMDEVSLERFNHLPLSGTSTPTNCGASTGTITATASGGTAPYQYSIDLGPLQSSGTFTGLPQGPHTIIGVDAAGCTDTITVNVGVIPNIPGSATTTATGCPGVNNGTFTVTPTGGSAPYTYSMDGGPSQSSNVFTNVGAGAHTVIFTDANGCSGTVTKTVNAGASITSTATTAGTSCNGASDGSVTITATSGTGPYTYAIDGGTFGSTNVFTGLPSGAHTISIRDASGCTGTKNVTISAGAGLSISLTSTPTFCPGTSTGTIIVTHNNGTPPFTYTVGGNPAGSTNPIPGMSSGIKAVSVKDANGCTGTGNVAISNGSGITGTATAAPAGCSSGGGSITLNATTGTAPYTYALDGGTFQSSNVFTGVAAGNHTGIIKDANGCSVTLTANVGAGSTITGTATATPTACPGVNNGSVTVTATAGTAPYQYSIDGTTFQASNVFTNVGAGAQTITLKDANGCSGTVNVTVPAGTTITGTASQTPAACAAASNGTVTVTPTSGSTPYQYSIDGGTTFQASNTFSGLTPGAYTVTIKDASGCTGTVNITVAAGAGVSATATSTPTACPGVNNGSVTVTATAGTAPYQYSIDGTTFQTSNVFTNVGAGAQTITVKDANGCSKVVNVTVAAGTTITSTATQTPAACAAASNGTVTVTPTSGSTPYQYSVDGGTTFQASNTFSGLTPGAYTVTIKDASGCTGTVNITVAAGAGVSATATSTPTACPGVNNGSVTVTATAGTAPYQYSIDGTTFQASNVFTNVGAGAQTITVKDANGCSKVVNVTVAAGTTITSTATQTASSCPVAADGSLTVTPTSGTSPYQYSIDGGTTFQASNTFANILSGPYTVTIKDASGCTGTVSITVTAGVGITGTATSTPSTCAVAPNASITATATSGVAPYTYSIDGTNFQASNTFNNILSGSYTVTFKDNLGCTGTTTVTVSTGTGLTGTGTSVATSCPTVNNGSITITPSTGNAPYTYSLDGGASQSGATFTNISSGSHTVIFTDALGCTGQVTINVASGAAVTATATPVKTSCPTSADGSVTVVPNNGTAPYQFSIDGSAATQPTGVFSGLAVGPHSVTFTDANGCSGVVNFNIQAGPVITGTASATGASCPGISNGTITVTATSGLPPYKYSLDGGTPQTSNVFNGVSSGPHTVVITDALACNTATINVSVSAGTAITGTATATPTTCPGVNNGKITVTPSTGTAPYQYSIDGGVTYQSSNEFTNLATGSYTITFNDANGCPATVTANVTEGAGLVVTATSVATSCPGVNNGTLTVSPTTGTAPYTYTLTGRPSQPSATFTNLATGTYTIQVKDALGCTGSVTETVDEGVDLTSTLDLTQPVCFGINDGIIKINATSGTAPYTYTVSGLPSQASSTFNNLPPDNYTITIKDAVGCTGTNTATLVSNPEIVLTPAKTDPLCFGSADGTINIATAGGVSPYTYTISGGSGPQSINEFTGLTVGSYTIVVKDNLGCQKSVNVALAQPTKLIASATSPAPSTCLGGDGEITVAATGGTSPYSYSIDNGASYPFQTSPTFTVGTGTYSNVAVKDANGCIAGTSVFVNVIDNMFLTVGNDTTICQGEPVTFNVLTNAETNVFRWRDTVALNDANIKNATATPADTTTYILHAEWGACSREDTITINVKLLPIPEAGPEQMICLNDSTIISGSVSHTSGTVNYTWSPAQYVRDPNLQTTRAIAPATQTYVLTVTDNYGCNFSVSDSVKVIMQPTVPAYAGGDTLAAINKPHVLVGSGGVQYHWTPLSSGVRIDNPDLQYPTVYLSNDANFMVKVTDIAGCVGYDSVYVQVYEGPEYYIPNAFTPNGDGLNDIFRPLPVKMTRQEYFRIFNRFGELVFETNQYMKGWDGTYKGKPQPTGVYVWILKGFDAKGMKVEMKGTITIVR